MTNLPESVYCIRCGGYAKPLPETHTTTRTMPIYRCVTCKQLQQWMPSYKAGGTGGTWYSIPRQGT